MFPLKLKNSNCDWRLKIVIEFYAKNDPNVSYNIQSRVIRLGIYVARINCTNFLIDPLTIHNVTAC